MKGITQKMSITFNPIGVIQSNFDSKNTSARQPTIDGRKGTLVLYDQFIEGLDGLAQFSHIIAIYHFHLQQDVTLRARPCFDPTSEHGIFASRYPTRPNHIGISILTLEKICGNTLFCSDVDVINNTPLLDIKPYVRQFDRVDNPKSGWYDSVDWDSHTATTKKKSLVTE